MTLVWAGYVPNAPFLIDPPSFGDVGARTAKALRDLELLEVYRPDVVVVSTPHWTTRHLFQVHEGARPRQLFDFAGMPPALHQRPYEPPGDPAFAKELVEAGLRGGIPVEATTTWGLDHGAWAPLLQLAPGAKVPVVPISIRHKDPKGHLRWGEAMRGALSGPKHRVAFVATGSIIHDFDRFSPDPTSRWPEGEALEQKVIDLVLTSDLEGLLHLEPGTWAKLKPEGDLGPLFTLLGTLPQGFAPRLVFREHAFGGFSLTTIEWRPQQQG